MKFSKSSEEFKESDNYTEIYEKINHSKKREVQSRHIKIIKVKDN